ncbi:MAG TPA: phosphoribosyltransferase family protein [Gemmatimonadaceae bacterium]|nr:phosphoribosyltransferase family protein [Gemmatimonadaceae bacterium]
MLQSGMYRPLFQDRRDAGRQLGSRLAAHAHRDDTLVLGLPRGGVIVASEVARALEAPLDVLVVRKLGAPHNEEFAIGAIASGGVVVVDRDLVRGLQVPPWELEALIGRERRELQRRELLYRGARPFPSLADRVVIVVDDGLATGATMRAAVDALRERRPARVIAAAPVGASEACEMLVRVADACVCAAIPEPFGGVGVWYEDFAQTTDEEVIAVLEQASDHGVTSQSR